MRVKDAVRVTSVVQRLKVGERFTDSDGDWEVTKPSESFNDDAITLHLKRFPDGKQSRSYVYDRDVQVKMIRK